MVTNILAQVILTLVTNVTNVTFEMPSGTDLIYTPSRILEPMPRTVRPSLQRTVVTNVYERSTITWVLNGRTNSCTVDRTIYSASQVMKLRETWEPSGALTIHNNP